MLSDSRGVPIICILFLDFARFVIGHFLSGRMPGAYSEDRWRIIWYKFLLMWSDKEIAFQFFVCPRTVQRICQNLYWQEML